MTLAIATALAVGFAPTVLGGTAAVAAPLTAVAATGTATIVQEGGPLVVSSGEEGAVTTRIRVTLPAGLTGPVKARLLFPQPTWELPDFDTPAYEPVTPTCAVNGGAFWPCPWDSPGNEVVFPAAEAATTLTYDIRVDADSRAAVMGNLTAALEVTDGAGAAIGSGPVAFRFAKGTPENYRRTTVLARDKAGVLWQYESTGRPDKPLKARERIGGGWNAYTALVGNWSDLTAVARDRAGVLWSHGFVSPIPGGDFPGFEYAPRVRVGGGWNVYDRIALAGQLSGSSENDFLARDTQGRLWLYEGVDRAGGGLVPSPTRRQIGWGWGIYDTIL